MTRFLSWPVELPDIAYRKGLIRANNSLLLSVPSIPREEIEGVSRAAEAVVMIVQRAYQDSNEQRLQETSRLLGFDTEATEVLRWSSPPLTRDVLMRADFVFGEHGAKLVELNAGGLLGGVLESSLPSLTGIDTSESAYSCWVDSFSSTLLDGDTVAIVNPALISARAYREAEMLSRLNPKLANFDIVHCTCDELGYDGQNLHLRGKPVTAVFPRFLPWSVAQHPEDYRAIRSAVADGRVRLTSPFQAEAVGSKSALALLWQHVRNNACTESVALLARKYIAETYQLRDRVVVAMSKDALVLKPSLRSGGEGVVVGRECTDRLWNSKLEQAATEQDDPHVLQEFVPAAPVTVLAKTPNCEPTEFSATLAWAVFVYQGRRRGMPFVRALRSGQGSVVNVSRGAAFGVGIAQ
jgi:hypothetical protein